MSSPLVNAVDNRQVEKVKQLLAGGANANDVSIDILLRMNFNGMDDSSYQILEALLDAGANVDAKSGPLGTPLLTIAATLSSDITATNLLLEKGANPNLARNNGETPLIAAIKKTNNLKNIQALLTGKADINMPNKFGKCPIHIAIETGDAAIVKLLLDNGASTEVTYGGKNVIDFVSENSAVPEIRALFEIVDPEGAAAAAAAPPVPVSSPGSKLPRTSAKSMARPGKCLDAILAEEVNIAPLYSVFYIRQPNGTAHAYCLDSMTLNTFLRSYDYVFYRCKPNTQTMLRITKAQIEPAQIRRLDIGPRIYVTNAQASKIKVGRAYILEQTTTPVGRLASHAVLKGGKVVSAMHCQGEDNDNGFMHNIKEIGTTKTRVARSSPGPKAVGGSRANRRRRTHRKNRAQFFA